MGDGKKKLWGKKVYFETLRQFVSECLILVKAILHKASSITYSDRHVFPPYQKCYGEETVIFWTSYRAVSNKTLPRIVAAHKVNINTNK